MFKPLFTLLAATFLLAACETASTITEEAAGSAAGDATASSSTATSSASTASSASSGSSSSSDAVASDPDNSALEAARAEMMSIGDTVLFGYDSSQLSADAMSTLDAQAALLNAKQSFRVKIEGHADERGTREYNLALGERRLLQHATIWWQRALMAHASASYHTEKSVQLLSARTRKHGRRIVGQ